MTPERKVGTFVAVALLLLVGGVFLIGQVHIGSSGYTVNVRFKFVNDLKVNAAVKYGGGPVIGWVEELAVRDGMVAVGLRIDRQVRIRKDCEFWIFTAGMLGEQYVEVHASPSGTADPLPDGATVRGIDPVSLDSSLIKLGKIVDVLAPIVAQEDVAASVYSMVRDMREVAHKLAQVVAKHSGSLDQAMADVGSFSRSLNRLAKDFEALTANVKSMTDPKNPESLQPAVKRLNATLSRMHATAKIVESLAKKIDEGQGLLGAMINDRELAEDFKALVKKFKDKPITAKLKLF